MITISEIATGVRDYLLYPDYGRLNKATVLLRIQDKSDALRQAMNITNRGWFISRFPFTADPGTDEIPITATAFGRPVNCLTIDDTDPNHIEREVEIVVLQNRNLFYTGAKASIGSFTSPHVAECVSVYNDVDLGGWYLKVTPQHTQSANYVLWFQPDRPTPPALADNYPLLESFTNLLKVDVALSCLPNIMVTDDAGNVKNAAQVAMIERRLLDDRGRYEGLFNVYRQTAVNEQTGPRRGWGDGDDSGVGYWW